MLGHVLSMAREAEFDDKVVVLGPAMEAVESYCREFDPGIGCVVQAERNGTADAVLKAREKLENFAGDVVVLRSGDGRRVGRGIVVCDHETAESWCAGERPAFARNHHALVHRDHLVLDPEPTAGVDHHE